MANTPKVKKVVKKVKKTKESKESVPQTVSEPVVETSVPETTSTTTESTTATTPEPVDPVQEISSAFKDLVVALTGVQTQARAAVSSVRSVEKLVTRRIKEANKKSSRKSKDPNKAKRAPSGFAKPSLISAELCVFLDKPENTYMARTEVTKHLTKYIKDNNLQDPLNKRKIVPDAALKKVLNVSDEDDVTYFNLQKHMKHHFPKTNSEATVASS
jgi:chromatin remodeling complex protein RSC6